MAVFVAFIPARGGSKGIKNKNILPVAGKPLVMHSIDSALNSRNIKDVFVSTDSEEIASIAAERKSVKIIDRPAHLASDTSSTEDAMLHGLEAVERGHGYRPDYIILLQPTSPYRREGRIDECIDRIVESGADSLLTVCENHSFFWRRSGGHIEALYDYKHRPRRQDIKESDRTYRENGSIYITRSSILLGEKNRLGGKIEMAVMSEEESIEIDSMYELTALDIIMRQAMGNNAK